MAELVCVVGPGWSEFQNTLLPHKLIVLALGIGSSFITSAIEAGARRAREFINRLPPARKMTIRKLNEQVT